MMSVVMLNVIMLGVVMLNVVAPLWQEKIAVTKTHEAHRDRNTPIERVFVR